MNIDLSRFYDKQAEIVGEMDNSKPFPNVVIDDFLPDQMLDFIVNNFPQPSQMDPNLFQAYERKIAVAPSSGRLEGRLVDILSLFNSWEMVDFLERITGIRGLIPDPHFLGAGFQQTLPGGKLAVHVDFNRHPHLKLERRLNVLIYLNKEWDPSWGGQLELWDSEVNTCVKRIDPLLNRCVVFKTSETSFHGLPTPLRCPKGESRKQINLYYYTSGREDFVPTSEHWTVYGKRPGSLRDKVLYPISKYLLPLLPLAVHNWWRRRTLS